MTTSNRYFAIASLLLASALSLPACLGGAGGGSKASGPQAKTIDKVPEGAVDPAVERFKIPVGDAPVKGPGDAKVTIIEVSDFQCPFCSRVVGTMEQVEKAYPKDVRVAFKHNPLSFHPNAMPAAIATVAAQNQGKFWEMHDLIFKNQQNLDAATFEKHAQALQLDLAKWKADVADPKTKAKVEADQKEAANLGARGTPSFFINGRTFSGAQPFENFKKVIDEELANADKAIKAGVAANQVYDAFIKGGKDKAAAAEPQKPNQPPAQDNTVYKVAIGASPQKGAKDAPVTVVIVSDFQCPFCSRVVPTMKEVEKTFGDKVRLVWKNNPLPFHPNAMPAAIAALAANKQGKFWEMHDKLFAEQQKLTPEQYETYAKDLQLNVAKWKKDMEDPALKKQIEEEQAMANQLGARGTPSFFINGKNLRGAQPFEAFKTKIEEALKDADAMIAKGVKKADVYETIIKDGKEKADAPAAQPGQPPAADNSVFKALIGDAPVKGAKDARVTIVEFSDFQCPFCSRVEPTVDKVLEAFPKDVRVAFKQLPLPFHDKAHLAAEATLAAKEQGKFWEMHKKLFANQQALDRPSLEKYAGELGLNLDKFKAALDSGKYKQKVDDELAEGNKIGARGTPSFFVNGKSFVGAQPFEAFKAKIEEELKNADKLIADKKIKPGQVYDELMKTAKEGAAPPPQAQKPAAEPEDTTIYKVDGGNGPSKGGPASAPVQIVEFSDFQCPFCSRVGPTMKQIEDKYGSKVRITWRNYPLPFHPNAGPAAEAALAAHAQGKFWAMHDKLFANQQALSKEGYEKFAGEIGLDVGKFKADMESGKFKKAVEADVAYANALPGGGMGTPTFFINGRKIAGAYPFDAFAKMIDEELAKKK